MKIFLSIGLWLVVCLGLPAQTNAGASLHPGIAVMLVYDGSGSMRDPVPDADQKPAPKFVIANKTVNSVVRQLLAYGQDKQVVVQVGLVDFVGGKIQHPIPLAPLTPERATEWVKWTQDFQAPSGGTPLGRAITAAHSQLAKSHCLHQHILVITDGISNVGPPPEQVLRKISQGKDPVPVYFVAFDVSAHVFDAVKAEGATVVSASDETQLNTQINLILGQKILLEAE